MLLIFASRKGGVGGGGLVYTYGAALHIVAVKVVIERPWLAVDGPFLSAQTSIENTSILYIGSSFLTLEI